MIDETKGPLSIEQKIERFLRKESDYLKNSWYVKDQKHFETFIRDSIRALREQKVEYFPFDVDVKQMHKKVQEIALWALPWFKEEYDKYVDYERAINKFIDEVLNIRKGVCHGVPLKGFCPICTKIRREL